MHAHPTILALDASSTTLGFCLYAGHVLAFGEHTLSGSIEQRCACAYNALWNLLHDCPQIDALAIESPVLRFASCIPQIRVSGALMALAGQRGILVVEVSPTAAKYALAGIGGASKCTMQARASAYGVIGEHSSDALGVALSAARQIKVVA